MGCYNKNNMDWMAQTTNIYFSWCFKNKILHILLKFGACEKIFSFVMLHQICKSKAITSLKKYQIINHLNQSSVQSLSHVWLFVTPWTAACQASLSITNSRSLPKFMSTESVMPSNHLILCRPLLLLPSVFPSIRVFSSESVLNVSSSHLNQCSNRNFLKTCEDFSNLSRVSSEARQSN